MGPLQNVFWHNAGFACLRDLDLPYPACYDPTVVPPSPPPTASPPEPADATPAALPPPSTAGVFSSCADYIAAYKSGATTPVQVAERLHALLADDTGDYVNYVIHLPAKETLLRAAEASAARYKEGRPLVLDGVPLLVKDELLVAGAPMTLGMSHAEAARRGLPEKQRLAGSSTGESGESETAWCVQKLLDAGMLFCGKSNMHELGLDTTNCNPHHGVPTNPYDRRYYPGGSSGGSAAAVGRGLVPIAVGADGGGSIRVPAAYCGVFGLKPSHGRLSIAPTASIAQSVGTAGPIAANLADLEIAYRVMAAPDPRASAAFPPPTTSSSSPLPAGGKKIPLGIYRAWFDDSDAAVRAPVSAAIDTLVATGHYETVDITLPLLGANRSAHALTILTEIGQGFCSGDTHGLSPATRILVAVSRATPARDFLLAQKIRALAMSHLAALWHAHPGLIIVSPVTPHVGAPIVAPAHAVKGGHGVSDSNLSLRTMQYVFFANWTGAPSVSVPVGYVKDGKMPVALMGMAEWGGEAELLRLAREWEGLWRDRRRGDGWVDVLTTAKNVG